VPLFQHLVSRQDTKIPTMSKNTAGTQMPLNINAEDHSRSPQTECPVAFLREYDNFIRASIVGDQVLVFCFDAAPWQSNIEVADAFLEAYRSQEQYQAKSLKLYVLSSAGKWWLLFNLRNPSDRYLHLRESD
jgi:hypothetical protein